jgi:predicted nucleic acid-binding protein
MKPVFADIQYWVALVNPKDECHGKAIEASKSLGNRRIITSDEVLAEFLTWFAG